MIYLNTGLGQSGVLYGCVPPYEHRDILAAAGCTPDRMVLAPGGGVCAVCCPLGRKADCGPGEKALDRDASGCVRCCIEDEAVARSRCANGSSIVRDAGGCWNCLCSSGAASITCPSGYSTKTIGGSTCCVPPPPPYPPLEPPSVIECPTGAGWRRPPCAAGEVAGASDPASGCVKCAPMPGCVPTTATPVNCGFGKKAVVRGAYTCCESSGVGGGAALVGLAILGYFLIRKR